MKLKNVLKWLIVFLILSLIIILGFFIWKSSLDYNRLEIKDNTEYNLEPVYQEHDMEFNIINSNYLEKNYTRYIAYKKLHSNYSDDKIITYVNIGLDRPFYTNMENTDMSDGILIICNKYHTLKSNYVPDLVSLSGYGGGMMQREAASFFKKMVNAAKNDGVKIWNVSGYRSYSTQKNLYNSYVSRDGVKGADMYSARPGTSEHQTGLATDVNSVKNSFKNTKAYAWLIKNSYKYGFILRYPEGKTSITGYMYEPWHYRYVGMDVAKIIYEKNITYEEYYATYILKG